MTTASAMPAAPGPERAGSPQPPPPQRWSTQAEAIRYFESLTCDQIVAIAHEFRRE